jgi:hypothetical protein
VLAIAAPLALLSLMGNRRVEPVADPRKPLQAEIARLEEEISESASDVAELRLMVGQARTELATLLQQKETEQAALADLQRRDRGAGVPGTDQPFYTAPPPPRELVVNAPRTPRTVRDYLSSARRHIAAGRSGAASAALEMAETRVLNGSPGPAQNPNRAKLVRQIGDARRLLVARDLARSAKLIDSAMLSTR